MKKIQELNREEAAAVNGGADSNSTGLNVGLKIPTLLHLTSEGNGSDGEHRKSEIVVGRDIDLNLGLSTDQFNG